ncbi:MAG: alanine racemase [Alphaproteobacteria bacterium]|nr:alanine racemase [Alphaproteobacteria bacterium]
MNSQAAAGAVLTIDLGALANNWNWLRKRLRIGAELASVVKADGYGLGALQVGAALAKAGCKSFFVARLDEGISLRKALGRGERIFVLDGVLPGTALEFSHHDLIPVLNEPGQIAEWTAKADGKSKAALHVDTGMNRLGLSLAELEAQAPRLDRAGLCLLMSHLACAEESENPKNAQQLERFNQMRRLLPPLPASLSNSSGVFLGADYHFDLVRAGVALYGVNPTPDLPNPMTQVVQLQGKIVQVRDVDLPETVGYGATHKVSGRTRIATVAVGYADGWPRSLSNRGFGVLDGVRVPLVGRVSMDLITFDVTGVPQGAVHPGAFVTLLGEGASVDEAADAAGTIGYEILTNLGPRYFRRFVGG